VIVSRLDGHDRGVNDAGPDGEADEAQIGERIARRQNEEHAERGVDAGDHLLVLALPRLPSPAVRPQPVHERIDAEDQEHPEYSQREAEIAQSRLTVHGFLRRMEWTRTAR